MSESSAKSVSEKRRTPIEDGVDDMPRRWLISDAFCLSSALTVSPLVLRVFEFMLGVLPCSEHDSVIVDEGAVRYQSSIRNNINQTKSEKTIMTKPTFHSPMILIGLEGIRKRLLSDPILISSIRSTDILSGKRAYLSSIFDDKGKLYIWGGDTGSNVTDRAMNIFNTRSELFLLSSVQKSFYLLMPNFVLLAVFRKYY
ncbi:9069_t:CDS:2 [Ambispora gerdemannii]|uniref:9069_t:CDS:1 n=1 Tax=Ambispora gerdemannii TaxID=144530 RepID=A0A9N9C6L9_9GLOM|nr:9069_t:CDS:2 [Ambispora gerdemannii]